MLAGNQNKGADEKSAAKNNDAEVAARRHGIAMPFAR
jgi:hypothetical protein